MMGHGLWGGCCSGILGGIGSLGIVGSILNLVLSVGLIIGLVIFLVWAVRRLGAEPKRNIANSSMENTLQSPLDILKLRYAKGEITQQEYQEMSKAIQ
ncbi:MAG: hypothetical protein DRI46_11910 [Chloroflexi bacterium]|nr:MAG: hypothetical protein DRI46_11910 [Chloroflexota bacterium]